MNKIVDFTDKTKIEQQAAAWVVRLDADAALSVEERTALKEWLSRGSAHREQLRRLAHVWNSLDALAELAVPLGEVLQTTPQCRGRLAAVSGNLAVAATVVIGLTVGAFYFLGGEPPVDSNGLYATSVGQQRSVELPDGSVVRLNTDSQIRVTYGDASRDIALLKGEALFTVSKDPARPFRVAAGYGEIRAVGTAFSVYRRGDSVEVIVTEGVVALAAAQFPAQSPSDEPGVPSATSETRVMRELGTLRAGQTGTISSQIDEAAERVEVLENIASVGNPSLSRRLSWTEGVLYFSGEPLDDVVKEISRYTTLDIEFADPQVGDIRIGGRFPVGETDTMLETLENTFGLRVVYLSNDRVLISAGDR